MRSKKFLFFSIVLVALGGLAFFSVPKVKAWWKEKKAAERKAAVAQARASESNAIVAKLAAKQESNRALNVTTIDLSSVVNAPLTDSFVPKKATDNNLAELPEGIQTLAGVPFSVKGSIQLTGTDLRLYSQRQFPKEVTNIAVGKKCEKLHILHGSYFIKKLGITVARLVLHYTDGSTHEIPIISGRHVLDWWAPNYETGVRKDWQDVSEPGSELAWVGSNAYIKKRQPHLSLRLFKSTFENPRSGSEIATVDYISAESTAAPFLLGLTVEEN